VDWPPAYAILPVFLSVSLLVSSSLWQFTAVADTEMKRPVARGGKRERERDRERGGGGERKRGSSRVSIG